MKDQFVSTEHLLIALTHVDDQAKRLLEMHGVEETDVLNALKSVRGAHQVTDQNPEEKYQAACKKYRPRPGRLGQAGENRPGHRPRR